jgi:hypothetical protein
MRKSLIPLAFAAGLAATGALADTATGTIAAINPATLKITLADGSVYVFPASAETRARFDNFKVGDLVRINWVVDGTAKDANAISPVMS